MGQLPSSAFQTYDPSNASSIQPGPFALANMLSANLRLQATAMAAQSSAQ
jgi:hypothetical protein